MLKPEPNQIEVLEVLRAFSSAYGARNVEETISLLDNSEKVLLIGSHSDEIATGLEQARKMLNREYAEWPRLDLELRWGTIQMHGDVAWATTLSMAPELGKIGRFSAILIKSKGGWKIIHIHFSFPYDPE